jgi:hypothetical protein
VGQGTGGTEGGGQQGQEMGREVGPMSMYLIPPAPGGGGVYA